MKIKTIIHGWLLNAKYFVVMLLMVVDDFLKSNVISLSTMLCILLTGL